MQEIEVLLKNANDPALIDMKLSLIKSPAFFAMSTPQPFRRRRVERANNAPDNWEFGAKEVPGVMMNQAVGIFRGAISGTNKFGDMINFAHDAA